MHKALISLLFIFLFSCSSSENYKTAYKVAGNNKLSIKVKGKRVAMSHDVISVFKNGTYEDSILIPVASFSSRVIRGEDIPVGKGYYQYTGKMTIDDNKFEVDLYITNTDDKTQTPFEWNGEYMLVEE